MSDYPLRQHEGDIQAFSGRPLSEIKADAIANDDLSADDLRTHASTLQQQAQIAQEAGYPQLARNLLRAAELTRVPNEELLNIYEMLRPERSSYEELMRLAEYLETTYEAPENARFIREAAGVYQTRGLLRR